MESEYTETCEKYRLRCIGLICLWDEKVSRIWRRQISNRDRGRHARDNAAVHAKYLAARHV